MTGLEMDTAPSEVERYFELLRTLTPSARLKAAACASRRVRMFAEAGLRQRHPHADDAEIRIRLTSLLYGPQVARRVHGELPSDL